MKHSTYVNMPDWMYFGDRKGLEEANIGHNNTYYFTLTLGSASTTWFESFFPNNKKEFSCKKEGVPVKCWLIDAFTAGFLTFDI
ncbi:MAG: hypothetical protein LBP53_05825 [Candidatus Peribacteria bacterium]|jgi:hypothetical protein|nr:hypothetical protein [Candidatus Peribacteria bacterium]